MSFENNQKSVEDTKWARLTEVDQQISNYVRKMLALHIPSLWFKTYTIAKSSIPRQNEWTRIIFAHMHSFSDVMQGFFIRLHHWVALAALSKLHRACKQE